MRRCEQQCEGVRRGVERLQVDAQFDVASHVLQSHIGRVLGQWHPGDIREDVGGGVAER